MPLSFPPGSTDPIEPFNRAGVGFQQRIPDLGGEAGFKGLSPRRGQASSMNGHWQDGQKPDLSRPVG